MKAYRVRYRLKGEDWQILSADYIGEPSDTPLHYAYRSQADIGALWVALHLNWENVHVIDGADEICSYVKMNHEGRPIIIGGKPNEDVQGSHQAGAGDSHRAERADHQS